RGGGGESFRGERLELDGVRPGPRGEGHEVPRELDVAVVVDACLGDDKARMALADRLAAELNRAQVDPSRSARTYACPTRCRCRASARPASRTHMSFRRRSFDVTRATTVR